MRMKILPHVVSMSLALCAAFTAGASPVMSIYDPAEFSLFASRFRAEMSAAGIVDADGSYYEPFFNLRGCLRLFDARPNRKLIALGVLRSIPCRAQICTSKSILLC